MSYLSSTGALHFNLPPCGSDNDGLNQFNWLTNFTRGIADDELREMCTCEANTAHTAAAAHA